MSYSTITDFYKCFRPEAEGRGRSTASLDRLGRQSAGAPHISTPFWVTLWLNSPLQPVAYRSRHTQLPKHIWHHNMVPGTHPWTNLIPPAIPDTTVSERACRWDGHLPYVRKSVNTEDSPCHRWLIARVTYRLLVKPVRG